MYLATHLRMSQYLREPEIRNDERVQTASAVETCSSAGEVSAEETV